jgi:hypothetical protein
LDATSSSPSCALLRGPTNVSNGIEHSAQPCTLCSPPLLLPHCVCAVVLIGKQQCLEKKYRTATGVLRNPPPLPEELHVAAEKFSSPSKYCQPCTFLARRGHGTAMGPSAPCRWQTASGSSVASGQRFTRSLGRCRSTTPRASLWPLQRARGSELQLMRAPGTLPVLGQRHCPTSPVCKKNNPVCKSKKSS